MRLEDYWGVGPKTRELLDAELGTERAVDAIESADVRTLTAAGLSRGRATRILRRVTGGEGMDVLATPDARAVYKRLLDVAGEYALTEDAADRIRLLTPLLSDDAAEARLDDVLAARSTWEGLDDDRRAEIRDVFATYDEAGGGERSAVEAARSLAAAGVTDGPFAPIADLDREALAEASAALAKLSHGSVRAGADQELDDLREARASVEALSEGGLDLLESLRADGVRDSGEFREGFVDHVTSETGASYGQVREATADDATDAADFVSQSLRALSDQLAEAVAERESAVAAELEASIDRAREDVDRAVETVDEVAFHLSLARFSLAFGLTRPEFVDDRSLAVRDARNLSLAATDGEAVQPVTYAVGEHDLAGEIVPPQGDRVTVLTGANSGGKTTLLETLCQVALLAQMGLPVPAAEARVTVCDSVVFHRRHASFNAGVLESTLRSIVPPLADDGRTLMLVDEFEAITEPGSAANLLHGLVDLTVDQDALGVFVTHLADDLKPLPDSARIDGIFAEGLNQALELEVDYQPRFATVGKSTPEFIVSRLVADARDRHERAGFETLARAVGEEAVQRTLADARWEA